MGLDIYLYTAIDAAQNDAHDKASEAFYERPDYDELTKEQRAAARRELPPYTPHVDVPSERHPGHLFNRRYLRSSYNGGGFNHAVPQLLSTSGEKSYPHERGSLYWIFEPMGREWDGDSGELTHDDIPKLLECRDRAQSVADELKGSDRLCVLTVAGNIFSAPPTATEDDALRTYRETVARGTSFGDDAWYSTLGIEVFGSGMTLLGAVPGKGTFGEAAVHLVYRGDDESFSSYVESAEIVVEFCDEAISLVERDGGASMSWSG